MTYIKLRGTINTNLFTILDVTKAFPNEKTTSVRMQLFRLTRKGLVGQIKRGLYYFDSAKIDELELANRLFSPSYISLETALNYYGLIPDIPATTMSVTTITTRKIKSDFGSYYFLKIKPELYFGYSPVVSTTPGVSYNIAQKEKALLDYLYLRRIKTIADLRFDLTNIDKKLYQQYVSYYPSWVQKIKI